MSKKIKEIFDGRGLTLVSFLVIFILLLVGLSLVSFDVAIAILGVAGTITAVVLKWLKKDWGHLIAVWERIPDSGHWGIIMLGLSFIGYFFYILFQNYTLKLVKRDK